MRISTEAETAEAFIRRATVVLQNEATRIYLDTSFLMWLTTLGPTSRAQFFAWTDPFANRMHVPLWAMHEYYRHHIARTLRHRLERSSGKLLKAAEAFLAAVKPYTDWPLLAGEPEAAYNEALRNTIARLSELTAASGSWDYEFSAIEMLRWMNEHACETDAVFKSVETLAVHGAGRFTQDIPPGFLDRHKTDKAKKGSNRYGDLLFWEEVMLHAANEGACAVVIVTRDRKDDWYSRVGEAVIEPEWKRLRSRWNSVPAPHPTLAFELKIWTGIGELVLLDELYLGAILWKTGRPQFERLAACAIDVDPRRFEPIDRPIKPATSRAQKRRDASTLGLVEALGLIDAALKEPDDITANVLEKLDDEAPQVDAFVAGFSAERLNDLTLTQVAAFARWAHDRARRGPGPAQVLASRILDMLDQFDPDRAAAVYVGLAVSAYFDRLLPRSRPSSHLLGELFEWQGDLALKKVLQAFALRLKKDRSPALYIPNSSADRVRAVLEHDASQKQMPAALRQLFLNDRAVLTDAAPGQEQQLRSRLNGAAEASVRAIVQAACTYYGIPFELTDIEDGSPDELRSIPEFFGVREFDRFTNASELADTLPESSANDLSSPDNSEDDDNSNEAANNDLDEEDEGQ